MSECSCYVVRNLKPCSLVTFHSKTDENAAEKHVEPIQHALALFNFFFLLDT